MGQIPSILVRFRIVSNCCSVRETDETEQEEYSESCPTTSNLNSVVL